MYFDFQDGHPDLERVPSALSAREGVLVSIIVHLLVIIAILLVPQLPFFKARAAAAKAAAEAARLAMLEKQRENRTFVFVQPKVELEPLRPPPPQAPLSDRDRTPNHSALGTVWTSSGRLGVLAPWRSTNLGSELWDGLGLDGKQIDFDRLRPSDRHWG
jgi:hypothetical protein